VLGGNLESRPRHPERQGSHQRTRRVEHPLGSATARGARFEHLRGGQPAILEDQTRRVGGPDPELALLLPGSQAAGVARDDKRPQAGSAGRRIDRSPDHVDARDAAVGRELLAAIEDVVIAVLHRGGGDTRDVRSSVRLLQRQARHLEMAFLVAPVETLAEQRPLRRAPRHQHGGCREGGPLNRDRDPRTTPAQLLDRNCRQQVALGGHRVLRALAFGLVRGAGVI
jgi:hypothetical protein